MGAKASLAILGALGPDGVSRAIALGDWNAVKAARGVGPKIAQRVVLDLKDKAPGVMAMGGTLAQAQGDAEAEVIEPAAPVPPAPPPLPARRRRMRCRRWATSAMPPVTRRALWCRRQARCPTPTLPP